MYDDKYANEVLRNDAINSFIKTNEAKFRYDLADQPSVIHVHYFELDLFSKV